MNTLKLALYNVFRNKRRTMITLLSIISASCAIIVFGGFIAYTFEALREGTIRTQLGHFQIATNGYFEKGAGLEVSHILKDPNTLEKKISALDHVQTVTQRLFGSGLVSTGSVTLSGILIGVVPEKEADFSFSESILDGSQLTPGNSNECVIGEGLAKGLNAKVGDNLTVLATTLEGVINATECTVCGVVLTGSKTYDAVYFKMHLQELQKLLDTEGIAKLLVLLDETKNVPLVSPAIQKIVDTNSPGGTKIPDGTEVSTGAKASEKANVSGASEQKLEMREWEQLAEFYSRVVNLYTSIFNFSSIVLAGVVLLSITNTMSMCVFERFREIGTLRAIGETRSGIMRLFLSEGLIIGVLGGIVGIFVGIICGHIINFCGGIYISPPPGMSTGYTALITPTYGDFLWSFAIAVLASVGASFYPAYKASRLDIVKALQHV